MSTVKTLIGNVKGPKGDTGAQGATGATGATGPKGATGATGVRGSRWAEGTAITGTSTTATIFSGTGISDSLVNDQYLNTSTGNIYRCTVAGAASVAKWVYVGNIKGPTGAKGATGATGATGPQGPTGATGASGTADTSFTIASSLTALVSGEAFKTMLGKIAKAVSTLISHISTSATTSTLGHVKFGTASGTACQGNDSRLSDSRTPKSHASTGTSYGAGSTSNYGHVKLTDSTAVTDSTGLALPATEKNASVEGTMAHDIAELNSNLDKLNGHLDSIAGITGAIRFTGVYSVSFNNISYAVVNLNIPEGYTLPTWCMAIGSINVASGLPVISKITKYSDTQLLVHLNENVNETLEIMIQYTIVKK